MRPPLSHRSEISVLLSDAHYFLRMAEQRLEQAAVKAGGPNREALTKLAGDVRSRRKQLRHHSDVMGVSLRPIGALLGTRQT